MASGAVKSSPPKGFPFIGPTEGGSKSSHISVVKRAGMSNLNEGWFRDHKLEGDQRTGKQPTGQFQA